MRWAPLSTKFGRRRETAAILIWITLMPILLSCFLILLTSSYYWIALAYIVAMAVDTAPETGGRKWQFLRQITLWRWIANYFPMTLVKTVDLDPCKNYVFGYHPHGIISLGAFIMFATEARDFTGKFPGINLNVLTLSTNFKVPFFRDLLLSLGFCSVSRTSIENILARGPGSSCMIVTGGAAESLYAFPGKYDLVIKKRYGFIKLALRSGASLVPVICFGENDLWDQVANPPGSTLRAFQQSFQKYASFAPPAFHGRGIFQYDYGVIPHRKCVVSVVGTPIDCPTIPEPTNEDVIKYQKLYLNQLSEIFDTYKEVYAPNRKSDLNFVE